MKLKNLLLLTAFLLTAQGLYSQQTVGLFTNTTQSFDGYTLFAPIGSTTTYLINNCGEKVHSWPSNYRPGQSVYLLENGNLLRTGNTNNSTFNAGGKGGIIEIIDWNGTVIWDYTLSSTTQCQHHDVEYLPNGNILAIVWDAYTSAQATAAGRTTAGASLWADKIVEIQPDFTNGGGTIAWEWKAWDHLVQDENATANNFGSVANSPQLIDVNYVGGPATGSDWLHINSVDYNPTLDQIVLSNHNFSEIWIIDHSTTTAEASGHTGGNSGKGGDLLYRWGNPRAYNQGTINDQLCFAQHNAYWIDSGYTDAGMIMIFNNQTGSNYSTVDVLNPAVDASGNYSYTAGKYAPSNFHWTYTASTPSDFYAANISGAQRLPNGNTLICQGPSGRLFEVDKAGTIVWEYISPVSGNGIIAQQSPAMNNLVFRAERYAADYTGFSGKTLTSQGYIESGSTFPCNLFMGIHEVENPKPDVFPNPANGTLNLSAEDKLEYVVIYTTSGQKVLESKPNSEKFTISVAHLTAGIYLLELTIDSHKQPLQKLVIN